MKVYVATTLTNIERAREVIAAFRAAGHQVTYDWTVHGSVNNQGEKQYAAVASMEVRGVRECRVLVALLPGGRGTHVELGAALGLGIPVLVVDGTDAKTAFDPTVEPGICAFYYHPLVTRVVMNSLLDDALVVTSAEQVVKRHESTVAGHRGQWVKAAYMAEGDQ